MILVSFFLEENVLSDEIKICYIFEYQSNENRPEKLVCYTCTRYKIIVLYQISVYRVSTCTEFHGDSAQQKPWCQNYTTGANRGPHHAFYTGVKFAVSFQHPVVLL